MTPIRESHEPGTVNIWTGKRLGGRGAREAGPRVATKYRCQPELDSGWTRGEASGATYCCLYFARGLCHHGAECAFLHRVPDAAASLRHERDRAADVFGRDRNPAHRDGRKRGTGSYERECRTLYVEFGGSSLAPDALRAALQSEFADWGELEDVHVVARRPLAFVRFRWRAGAEFAKAASHQQRVAGLAEPLDVRWANDDPNPAARRRVDREREAAVREAYNAAVNELDPGAKRARLQELHLAATGQYPDTDAQYALAAGNGGGGEVASGYAMDDDDDDDLERPAGGWLDYYYNDAAAPVAKASNAYTDDVDDVARYLTPEERAELEAGPRQMGTTAAEPEADRPQPQAAELSALLAGYGSDAASD